MLRRLRRTLLSFAIIPVAYVGYCIMVLPWLEPSVSEVKPLEPRIPTAGGSIYGEKLAQWLPPGSWELDEPKVLDTGEVLLILRDMETLENGQMLLKPCTIILFAPVDDKQTNTDKQHPIVMRAPQGAKLQFDRDIDPRHAEIGKIVSGQLMGEVTITKSESHPGAGDDLHAVTQSVQINQQRISAPNDVRFRYGKSYGSGRDLIINLLSEGTSKNVPEVSGIRNLELVHVDKFHLEGNSASLMPSATPIVDTPPKPGNAKQPQAPLNITCDGPFQIDFERRVASFDSQVKVVRQVKDARDDYLECNFLEIFFAATSQKEKGKSKSSSIERIVAVGTVGQPVKIESPSEGASARGERLEYDFLKRRIRLQGKQPVQLSHQGRHVIAAELEVEQGQDGSLQKIWAAGPGRMRGPTDDTNSDFFDVTWQDRLQLGPDKEDETNQVASLIGAAKVELGTLGKIAAGEIHFWMTRPASTPGQTRDEVMSSIVPKRLLAINQVKIDSPKLTGAPGRLEIWFDSPPVASVNTPGQTQPQTNAGQPFGQPQLRRTPAMEGPTQRFDIAGDLLRLRVVRADEKMSVEDVIVMGNVTFVESQTNKVGDVPLKISGDNLEVKGASSGGATMSVQGQPAIVSARGMSISGNQVQLDQAVGRCWIDGAGRMRLPIERDLQGVKLKRPDSLIVAWKGAMNFNGRTASFREGVTARSTHQIAAATALDVSLAKPVSFTAGPKQEKVEVSTVVLEGDVVIDNRTLENGKLLSVDRIQVARLSVNQISGHLEGKGPGWIRTVRLQQGNPLGQAAPVRPGPQQPARPKPAELIYLKTTFERGFVGNIHRREVQFIHQIQVVYGPIKTWSSTIDPQDRTRLGERDVVMNCDRLKLYQLSSSTAERAPIEMEATGNSVVEGRTFTARGERISYSEAKDMLVLKGSDRNYAELWRQQYVGAPRAHASAREIHYWPRTNRVDVDKATVLDIGQLQGAFPNTPR